jgi:hypothetical protein
MTYIEMHFLLLGILQIFQTIRPQMLCTKGNGTCLFLLQLSIPTPWAP